MNNRSTMNGKPVLEVPAKSVLNLDSGFVHKLLCDGPTFSAGSACAYSCTFCYVPDLMRKNPHLRGVEDHASVVIRRAGAVEAIRQQLLRADGSRRFPDPNDNRVVYASPLVDVAANMDLVRETVEICKEILRHTDWQIRLLSKSSLLPKVAEGIPDAWAHRMIYGVSTGTLDDALASAFEVGCPRVSKRVESLHWLQDRGFRTFGMVCPSLPHKDYTRFAIEMAFALRPEKLEHVWGEVINVRGDSMTRTTGALRAAGYDWEAMELQHLSEDKPAWEAYARATFDAHAAVYSGTGKLRFLQYVTAASKPWWKEQEPRGAILL